MTLLGHTCTSLYSNDVAIHNIVCLVVHIYGMVWCSIVALVLELHVSMLLAVFLSGFDCQRACTLQLNIIASTSSHTLITVILLSLV